MANEIRTVFTTGQNIYGCVFQKDDKTVWYPAGEVFETWGTSARTADDYNAITLAEAAAGSGYYAGDFPTLITVADRYDVQLRRRSGATPADSDRPVGVVDYNWSGSAEVVDEVVPVTVTALCNYALSKVGGGDEETGSYRISSINDGTDTANLCRSLQPVIRKEVLVRADWNEATKFEDLGAEVSGIEKADWEFAFNLPSDYLGRAKQIDELYERSTRPQFRFQYDKRIVQGRLWTNHYSNEDRDSAYISYTFNLIDPSKFSAGFYEAHAVKLAAEISTPLLADNGARRFRLLQEYEDLVLPVAIGNAAMQDGDDEDQGEYQAVTIRTR